METHDFTLEIVVCVFSGGKKQAEKNIDMKALGCRGPITSYEYITSFGEKNHRFLGTMWCACFFFFEAFLLTSDGKDSGCFLTIQVCVFSSLQVS